MRSNRSANSSMGWCPNSLRARFVQRISTPGFSSSYRCDVATSGGKARLWSHEMPLRTARSTDAHSSRSSSVTFLRPPRPRLHDPESVRPSARARRVVCGGRLPADAVARGDRTRRLPIDRPGMRGRGARAAHDAICGGGWRAGLAVLRARCRGAGLSSSTRYAWISHRTASCSGSSKRCVSRPSAVLTVAISFNPLARLSSATCSADGSWGAPIPRHA